MSEPDFDHDDPIILFTSTDLAAWKARAEEISLRIRVDREQLSYLNKRIAAAELLLNTELLLTAPYQPNPVALGIEAPEAAEPKGPAEGESPAREGNAHE